MKMDLELSEDIERQIEAQGAAIYKVSDGEVLVLTVNLLQRLLSVASEDRVILFIKRGAEA